MSDVDVESLLPNERVRRAVANGEMTQLTRGASNRYAEAGDTFELDGQTFEVTSVTRRTLGEFTDADARREGAESLEAYKRRMERVHPEGFEWDESDEVVTYEFEPRG
jgi:hypothetical protein